MPAGHPAHLVRDLVRESLDLEAIMAAYDEPRGYPPYHPGMMVAVLFYAYSQASTRRGGSPGRWRSGSTSWQ